MAASQRNGAETGQRTARRAATAVVLAQALLLALFAAAGPARAGAWLLPKGEGIAITTGSVSRAGSAFGAKGRRGAVSPFRKAEIQTLLEYGVSGGFTVRGRTEWRRFRTGDGEGDAGFGFSELGGRVRLFERGALVVSAEASARVAEARETVVGAAFMRGYESELDARLLGGTSFELFKRPAFANLEAGFRLRDGGRPDEIRADLTLGVRPRAGTLLLAQGFGTFAGAERNARGYNYGKLQASVVQDLTPRLAVQAGAFATVFGRNALAEHGLVLALWVRF